VLRRFTLIAVAALFASGTAHSNWAATPSCSPEKAKHAEERTETLRSWRDVRDWYKVYADCKDADAEEGYSEAIARLLVDHWNTLNQLVALTNRHFSRRR
jgi:hypothetical protein